MRGGGTMHIATHRKYHTVLSSDEQSTLLSLIRKGTVKARTITRARILLLSHEGKKDKEIISALHTATSTPHDIRKKYTEGGLTKALYDLPRPGQKRKLTGKQEAEVIVIACTKAPKGHVRWTLDLLTEEVTSKLRVSIGRTAIWKVLLRNDTKPWLKKNVVYSGSDA